MNSTAAQDTYALQRDLAFQEDHLEDLLAAHAPNIGPSQIAAKHEASIQPLRDRVAERQAEVGGVVFRIPEQNVGLLIEKLEKLNKRAAKLDVEPVSITRHEVIEVKTTENHRTVFRTYQFVAIKGHSPRLAGWRFVATLEHDENGVILRKLPTFEGEVDLTPYRTATPENCDHCKLNRRRNDTYVVQHEDGSLKQVGSNCLTDFLGGASPQQIARWMEYLADFVDSLEDEGSEFYGGSAPSRVHAREYMAHVACMVREHGWTSRGKAYEWGGAATADVADTNMYNQQNRATHHKTGEPMWIDPTDADYTAADKAIEWVRVLPEDELESDYLYNLFTVFKGESLGKRQIGIAASAISAHSKAVEKAVKAEAAKASEFVGAEGDKLELEVTIVKEIRISDYYNDGTKPLYMMQDASGNSLKWFSSRDIAGMEQGNMVTIKGTVKKLEDHPQYGKSTILTRCKMV